MNHMDTLETMIPEGTASAKALSDSKCGTSREQQGAECGWSAVSKGDVRGAVGTGIRDAEWGESVHEGPWRPF